jgi:hypothetical protein
MQLGRRLTQENSNFLETHTVIFYLGNNEVKEFHVKNSRQKVKWFAAQKLLTYAYEQGLRPDDLEYLIINPKNTVH